MRRVWAFAMALAVSLLLPSFAPDAVAVPSAPPTGTTTSSAVTAATLSSSAASSSTGASATLKSAAAASTSETVPLFLVMDTSGSMEGDRLRTAMKAAQTIAGRLDPQRSFGMYQYPAGKKQDTSGCSTGRWKIPPGHVKPSTKFTLSELNAEGGTPTGPALLEFTRSLEERGITRAMAVLVSDGEANCGDTDICAVATVLKQKNIDLIFNTVSFDNTLQGDSQLACLANATGGRAFTADQTSDLVAAIEAAAAFTATVDVNVPDPMPIATGDEATAASLVTIRVTNTGTVKIPDALVTVTVNSPDSANRRVRVPDALLRLGNLAPGVTVTRSVRLFPEGTKTGPVTWKVSVTSRSLPVTSATGTVQVTTDASTASAGPILKDAKSVVILGDSYSSGEGAGSYDPNPYLFCHRSSHAWGKIVFPAAVMVACSGAVTTDFSAPSHSGDALQAQLITLAELTAGNAPPDLVLLTLGGNDAGFAEVVKSCIVGKDCGAGNVMNQVKWAGIQTSLESVYRDINAVLNAPSVIARRGNVAQIVVLPYVRGLPHAGGDGCAFGFSGEELPMLNRFENALNSTISSGVTRARVSEGIPIQVADDVAGAFQPTHTICDDEPYLRFPPGGTPWALLSPQQRQEQFHPNEKGQAAQAASLVQWSRTAQPVPLTKSAATYDDIRVVVTRWGLAGSTLNMAVGAPVNRVLRPLSSLVAMPIVTWATEPGSQMVGIPGCDTPTCEFGPGPIFVTTYSVPVPVGTLSVDAAVLHGTVTIPLSTSPGSHTLVYEGTGMDGKPRVVKVPIRVWRSGTGAMSLGVGAGLVLVVTGLLLRLRSRRKDAAARSANPVSV